MNPKSDKLERLFSRYLDGECTAEESRRLTALMKSDRQVRADFADYRVLDEQIGDALRRALGRPPRVVVVRSFWARVGRGLMVAAAAGLAVAAWLYPTQRTAQQQYGRATQAGSLPSWFAPPTLARDVITPVPAAFERPELRLRGTQRDWIVIPGREPGTYFVIEVDHVRTHAIAIHRDF